MYKIFARNYFANHRKVNSETWVLQTNNDKGNSGIAVALITAIGLVIVALINKCSCEPNFYPYPTPLPIVDTLPHNEEWEWEDLDGSSGSNSVKVRIAYKIITDQFRWKFENHEYLDNGEKVKDALPKYLFSLPDFNKAIGIISVGMASEEGNDIVEETDRADRRADNILLALNPDKLAQNKNIYKLNLGQHRKTGNNDQEEDKTSYQRKIVLIGVMKWSGEMPVPKMEECLKDALTKSRAISFSPESYSTFKLTGYRIDYRKVETRE